MAKKRYAEGGLVERMKSALSNRTKVLDAAERQATGMREAPQPAPQPVSRKPITLEEAQAKAARFKWELENPGKEYKPEAPKMANGGMVFDSLNPWKGAMGGPFAPGPGVDPAQMVQHASGLRTMNNMGGFDPAQESGQWVPDTPEKYKAYIQAAAGNQRAGTTIGGKSVVDAIASESRTRGSTDAGWNAMASSAKLSPGGYPVMANGGKVKMYPSGGKITGLGGPTEDKQPILASPGEFIIPADSVQKIGLRNLEQMVDSTHEKVGGGGAGMWGGGLVDKGKNMFKRSKKVVEQAVTSEEDLARQAWEQAANMDKGSTGPARDRPRFNQGLRTPKPNVTPQMPPDFVGPGQPQSPYTPRPATPGPAVELPPGAQVRGTVTGGSPSGVTLHRPTPTLGQSLRGMAGSMVDTGKSLVKGAVSPTGIGLGAAMYSAETSEPMDSNLPKNGLVLSDSAKKLSDRERAILINDVNSGDPMKVAAAKLKLLGPVPQDYQTANAAAMGPPKDLAPPPPEAPQVGLRDSQVSDDVRNAAMELPEPAAPRSIDDVNAAARAQIDAMDARQNEAAQAENNSLRGMRLQAAQTQANYEADLAAQNAKRFPRDAGLRMDAAQKIARAQALAGQDQRNTEFVQGQATENSKNKRFTDAMKYRDDVGLRGDMYKADQALEGTKITAEGNLRTAKTQAQLAMQKQQQEQREKNRTQGNEFEKQAFTQDKVDDKGNVTQVYNGKAHQDYKKWVVGYAANNPAFKKAHGGKEWDDLTTTEREPIIDTYKRRMSLTENAKAALDSGNDIPAGLPTDIQVKPIETNDWVNFRTDGVQNSISLTQMLNGKLNPGTTNTADEQVVTMKWKTAGKPQRFLLSDVAKDPEQMRTLIDQIAERNPKAAAELMKRYTGQQ